MHRFLLLILAVLALGAAGFGLAQLEEARNSKLSLAAIVQERTALQKRIWDLQKKIGELESRLARTDRPAATALETDGPGESPSENGPASDWPRVRGRNDGGRFGALLANPEVQRLMAAQQKAGLDGRYSDLFKRLQLSPADLEKFKNLLVEKQAAMMDVLAATRAEGLTGPGNRDQVRQLVQDAQAEVDNTIRATLGDAGFVAYQSYEATVPERTVVSQLEQRLSYSATPLTDAQSAQMVQILAQTAPAGSANRAAGIAQLIPGGGPRAGVAGGTPITSDAITLAQSVLSAQQLSALQALQQEQQANALLQQQLRASFGRSSGATGATPTRTTGPGGG